MQTSLQTLKDLEFPQVLAQIASFAFSEKTIDKIIRLRPHQDNKLLINDLNAVDEFLSGIQRNNPMPFSEFHDLEEAMKPIEVENYYLPAEVFFKIKSNTLQIKEILKYIENFNEEFPSLTTQTEGLEYEKAIVREIDAVFNKFGEVKDDASPGLKEIRTGIRNINGKITSLFNKALTQHADILDDIRETVINNKRVLAVKSAFRKRIKGVFLGTSKTGSISFIEPENILHSHRELDELKEEEKREIIKILIDITAKIAIHKPLILAYQEFLEFIDITQAKAKYALEINAVLPELTNERMISLIDAYHPILWLNNRKNKRKTIPQTLELRQDLRIIIISGPNAGGKSITLKTVGLLQVMLQSGILIPVHPKSKIGFFNRLFTDIGDNQSIENHLSTYSYRLKQMSEFLRKSDENTLLLVDEFGTGSDPELGGALAEVFFEEFYDKDSFGIFTTHYTNIKLSAERLPQAINASMLFDKSSLEPLYILEIGQAGSSFTFEVAEKNNIPYRMINKAKRKVENDKIRLDKTILKLQQEKFEIQKTKNEVMEIKESSSEQAKEIEQTQERIQQKLFDFQQLYDREQKNLNLGKRVNDLADSYLKSKNKKQLVSQLMKLIEMENSKKTPENKEVEKIKKLTERAVQKELKENRVEIAQQVEVIEQKKEEDLQTKIKSLKVGDRVKIKDSSSIGTIEKIKNEVVFINYGMFTTKISVLEVNKVR